MEVPLHLFGLLEVEKIIKKNKTEDTFQIDWG